MLWSPTKVAAASCQAFDPVSSHLGDGTSMKTPPFVEGSTPRDYAAKNNLDQHRGDWTLSTFEKANEVLRTRCVTGVQAGAEALGARTRAVSVDPAENAVAMGAEDQEMGRTAPDAARQALRSGSSLAPGSSWTPNVFRNIDTCVYWPTVNTTSM